MSTLVENPLWAEFKLFELTEIMRQRDDVPFATALSHIPSGTLTIQEIEMFKKRTYKTFAELPPKAKTIINLFPFNKDVAAFNQLKLDVQLKLPGVERIISEAKDTVKNAKTLKQKNSALASVKSLAINETSGLPQLLMLQTRSSYMITTNIDVSDGLFNGGTGTLCRIDKDKKGLPSIAWIKFNDIKIGAAIRSKNRKTSDNKQNDQVPIFKITRPINRPSSCKYQVSTQSY